MKAFKIILIGLFLYFLALFESTVLAYFPLLEKTPNLLLLTVICWNLFENPEKKSGLYLAFFAGLLTDIFSLRPLGFNILIFIAVAYIMKLAFRRYVRIPLIQRA